MQYLREEGGKRERARISKRSTVNYDNMTETQIIAERTIIILNTFYSGGS